jgi:hypothetical protein
MLRLIHNLGGCGGTLLSRCIGVLPDVALLSEVNPASVNLYASFDPLYQDATWLHLLTETDREYFSRLNLQEVGNFRALIQLFYDRARARHQHLVIRDYNYIEFIGVPFCTHPPGRMALPAALPRDIAAVSIALIRHPVDQWLSLGSHQSPGSGVSPAAFCDAYMRFLNELGETPVYKYEEFIADPEAQFRAICEHLRLPFRPSFLERFHQFDSVTGNLVRLRDPSITLPARKVVAAEVMDAFRTSAAFHSILSKTGYSGAAPAEPEKVTYFSSRGLPPETTLSSR